MTVKIHVKDIQYFVLLVLSFPFYMLSRYKLILLIILILSMSFSPRIPIGELAFGRMLELRYEDFVLLIITILYFLELFVSKKRIYLSPLTIPIISYISLGILSTSLGILMGHIDPLRAFFFMGKEAQYFLIFLISLNLIRNYEDVAIIVYTLLFCGLINGLYGVYQFFSGYFWGYYGISIIGEKGPFPAGGYFSIMFFLSISSLYLSNRYNLSKLLSTIVALFSGLGLILTGSRANIFAVSLVFFIFVVFAVGGKYYKIFLVSIFLISIIPFNTYLIKKSPEIYLRLTSIEGIKNSLIVRYELDYKPLVDKVILKNPLIGLGKSILGTDSIPVEAHNHFLRILSEMGIIGLITFFYLLITIAQISFKTYKNKNTPFWGRVVSLSSLLSLISLMIASLTQDAFAPVRVNEPFWLLVGLTFSINKIIRGE